jgi:dUTP pyrophosphatase
MTPSIVIKITRTNLTSTDIPLPMYATSGSSGMDIHAAVEHETTIMAGETVLIPSGFQMEIPNGYEGQVRPRSGLAIKHGIGILNSPGTIDADYRGEVKVILTNFGKKDFIVKRGERIAQLVIAPVIKVVWEESGAVNETERGAGGFGHSGR